MKILISTASLTTDVILPVGSRTAFFGRVLTLLLAFSLALAGCAGEATLLPTPVSTPPTTIETTLAADRPAMRESHHHRLPDSGQLPRDGN